MGKNKNMGEVYSSCAFEQETNEPIKGGLFDEEIFGKTSEWVALSDTFGETKNFLPPKFVGKFGKIVFPEIFRCFVEKEQRVDEILVLPPIFRPIKELKVGQWATSDLNYLYRKIVVRNERLKRMLALSDTPIGVIKVECELLQEAILALQTELKRLLAENPNASEKVRRAIEKCLGAKRTQPDKQELYKKALRLAVEEGQISLSIVQRKLFIGYNLAGELVEKMEQESFIEPFSGAKARKVLLTKEKFNEIYGEDL